VPQTECAAAGKRELRLLTTRAASDEWVPTVCYGCYNACGVLARRVDGAVVDIVGDPRNPSSAGHLCAKGKARIASLYDPARLTTPLRRRNPEKGIGVDPAWEEISWHEALEEIAARLRTLSETDPRRLVLAHFDLAASPLIQAWATAFGTPHATWSSAALFCGMGSHAVNMMVNGSFNSEIDFEHCDHAVLIGTQMGFMVDSNAQFTTREMARARARGMRLTVVDPVCGTAAAKADNWVPIKPGTDAALALGILNELLNKLEVYDRDFLRKRTNAPYLVGISGRYARDPQTGKPLIWDERTSRAVAHDACCPDHAAIEGTVVSAGEELTPAFELLKQHVAGYELDVVERITDVPGAQVAALARELASSARIGATVAIDGRVLPLRPVAVNFKMGAVGHRHGLSAAFAIHLINIVLGAIDVPGGFLGVNPVGPGWAPETGPDGLLIPPRPMRFVGYNSPFPGDTVRTPATLSLKELFPVAFAGRVLYPFTILDAGVPSPGIDAEMLIQCRTNLVMSNMNPEAIANALARIPFMVSFATHLDETAEFADIVLPDAHDMERDDLFPANHPYAFHAAGPGVWYGVRRRAVVPPAGGSRPWTEVMLTLADMAGFGRDLRHVLSRALGLEQDLTLPAEGALTVADIADRQVAKYRRDPDADGPFELADGTVILRPKRLEEAYPGAFLEQRLPIYAEHFFAKRDEVQAVLDAQGVTWDLADYEPLPHWRPTAAHDEVSEEFDLFAVPLKLPFLSNSNSLQNAWLADLAERHPFALRVLMHRRAAAGRGIADGQEIAVTSKAGTVTGRVRLTEGIHPGVVAIAGVSGHWAAGTPNARGRGVHFNSLVPFDLARVDKLSSGYDSKIAVRVEPAEPMRPRGWLARVASALLPSGVQRP
jgi:anaerobic selenocysteine-containing dehydrogenase